jgi:hypothetical protein
VSGWEDPGQVALAAHPGGCAHRAWEARVSPTGPSSLAKGIDSPMTSLEALVMIMGCKPGPMLSCIDITARYPVGIRREMGSTSWS